MLVITSHCCFSMDSTEEKIISDPLVQFEYKGKTAQVSLSHVKMSDTLAHCIADTETLESPIIIPLDNAGIPLENLNQLQEVFDLVAGKEIAINIHHLRLMDWLDCESVWQKQKEESLKDVTSGWEKDLRMKWGIYDPDVKKRIKQKIIKFLDTASIEEIAENELLAKLAREFNITGLNKSEFNCTQMTHGPELIIRDTSGDTFWGAHHYFQDRTLNATKGLHFNLTHKSATINIEYYCKLFPHLAIFSIIANQKMNTWDHKSFCTPSFPLLQSLAPHIQHLKELRLHGVIFEQPLELNQLIELGEQLEKVEINSFADNNIQTCIPLIETGTIPDNKSLQELSLLSSQLSAIPNLIKKLHRLKKLDLSKNNITAIGGSQFPQDLERCNLFGNRIAKITDDTSLSQCTLENIRESVTSCDINIKLLLLKIFSGTETKGFII